MVKVDLKCPDCGTKNKLILLGNDSGDFIRNCKKCKSEININIDSDTKEVNIKAEKKNSYAETTKLIPNDYKLYQGPEIKREKGKNRLVILISSLILVASLMGFLTGFVLVNLPDKEPDANEINVEIVARNKTAEIELTEILVDSSNVNHTYLGNGTYTLFLKPGLYFIEVNAPNHKNASMKVYVPPQENDLKLFDVNQGIEGINRFVFHMEEGEGKTEMEDSVYVKINKWCPSLIFIFSTLGIWGAWTTYRLKSYKNAQIGAFFSILGMGFVVIGPIMGLMAIFLLPKIKDLFNRTL